MELALRNAQKDAGTTGLLARADEILVPKGIWKYSNPGGLLADALGAKQATTVLAELGILQQSLITRACQKISEGEADVVLEPDAELWSEVESAAGPRLYSRALPGQSNVGFPLHQAP